MSLNATIATMNSAITIPIQTRASCHPHRSEWLRRNQQLLNTDVSASASPCSWAVICWMAVWYANDDSSMPSIWCMRPCSDVSATMFWSKLLFGVGKIVASLGANCPARIAATYLSRYSDFCLSVDDLSLSSQYEPIVLLYS